MKHYFLPSIFVLVVAFMFINAEQHKLQARNFLSDKLINGVVDLCATFMGASTADAMSVACYQVPTTRLRSCLTACVFKAVQYITFDNKINMLTMQVMIQMGITQSSGLPLFQSCGNGNSSDSCTAAYNIVNCLSANASRYNVQFPPTDNPLCKTTF